MYNYEEFLNFEETHIIIRLVAALLQCMSWLNFLVHALYAVLCKVVALSPMARGDAGRPFIAF